MRSTCGINFAPLVLGENGDDDCIALAGYVINQRTLGAFWRSFSGVNSAKNTKSLTLSLVNDKHTSGALNNTISAGSSAKGAKSLTLGESRGKNEQKPLSTKGAKSRTLSKPQKKDRMLNFAPLVLGENGNDDCIALAGYVINQRTLGAFWCSFSGVNSAKNTKSLTLSLVNDKHTSGALNNTISAGSSAKGAKSLTLGESRGKNEQKPLSTKGAKSRTLSKPQKKDRMLNFAPVVLRENGNDDCIALAGYVINQRTLGAFGGSFSRVNSAKNRKSLTLSLVNDKPTFCTLNNTISVVSSAKGAKSLTLGESRGKSEQKPLSTKGAKSRTLSKPQKKDRMLNFAPVVLGENGDDDCIALAGYVINQRTFGAFWRSFSGVNSAKNTKSLTLSLVNDKPTFGALNNTISVVSSAKGAKSLTLGESRGKSEQKPLSTKGAKSLIMRIAHGIHRKD